MHSLYFSCVSESPLSLSTHCVLNSLGSAETLKVPGPLLSLQSSSSNDLQAYLKGLLLKSHQSLHPSCFINPKIIFNTFNFLSVIQILSLHLTFPPALVHLGFLTVSVYTLWYIHLASASSLVLLFNLFLKIPSPRMLCRS